MTSSLRKLVLTAHVTFSVGWLGAVAAFLVFAIAGLTSQDIQIVRSAYLAMDLTARFVIVPLAFASLVSGLIQSLGTPWGLFRHYWVLLKLLLTTFATIVLLVITTISVYKPWGLTLYGRRRQEERYQPSRSLRTTGVEAMSDPDIEISGGGLSRGLKILLAAGVGVFLVAVHISMHHIGHTLDHGH